MVLSGDSINITFSDIAFNPPPPGPAPLMGGIFDFDTLCLYTLENLDLKIRDF